VRITVLAGGIGGARFLSGLRAAAPEAELTVIGNVGDDLWLHGLRICPDLDTVMYTLGGGIDPVQGWGRDGDSRAVLTELSAYGAQTWFGLGDRDIATHLIRTQMLRAGYPLSAVTEALCARWQPGVRLLPVTDDRLETHVVIDADDPPGTRRAIHFQEWWVGLRAEPTAREFVMVGAEEARPGPGVLEAITDADAVLLAPSNPIVSLGPILAVPGVRQALAAATPVVGVSPIIGGAPVRGMADRCLTAVGLEVSAEAVGRSLADLLDCWLIDAADTAGIAGVAVTRAPLLMSDAAAAADLGRSTLHAAGLH
jgi:LPPG:FO 2-phospho-L-lactate transferase